MLKLKTKSIKCTVDDYKITTDTLVYVKCKTKSCSCYSGLVSLLNVELQLINQRRSINEVIPCTQSSFYITCSCST